MDHLAVVEKINYGGFMNNPDDVNVNQTDVAIARKIENAMIVKGINQRQLSEEAGIKYVTLRRSLKYGRSLTFNEFGRIANVLDIDPAHMLPESLTRAA